MPDESTWKGGVLKVHKFEGLIEIRGLLVTGCGPCVFLTDDETPNGLRVAERERFRDWTALEEDGWREAS